jgi:hypothetical protein
METTLLDPVFPYDVPRTDPEGWRLVVGADSHGQHKWVYLPPGDDRRREWKQGMGDRYWLGLETVSRAERSTDARISVFRAKRDSCAAAYESEGLSSRVRRMPRERLSLRFAEAAAARPSVS